jgi:hypothetical protein
MGRCRLLFDVMKSLGVDVGEIISGYSCTLIDEMWKEGRCDPFMILHDAISRSAVSFHRQYGHILDEREDVDFGAIIHSLKRPLELSAGYTLDAWSSYIRKTADNAMREVLRRRGIMVRKESCRYCTHLTLSKPHTCTLEKVAIMRDAVQESYDNPHYRKERQKKDPACTGFSARTYRPLETEDDADWSTPDENIRENERRLHEKLYIRELGKLLKDRCEKAPQDSKVRQKYCRQFDLFEGLLDLLTKDRGLSAQEAARIISENAGMKSRMIRRDIREIKNFLHMKVHGDVRKNKKTIDDSTKSNWTPEKMSKKD